MIELKFLKTKFSQDLLLPVLDFICWHNAIATCHADDFNFLKKYMMFAILKTKQNQVPNFFCWGGGGGSLLVWFLF